VIFPVASFSASLFWGMRLGQSFDLAGGIPFSMAATALHGWFGSGGFGITYEAEDVNLGTTVALKEYYPFDFGDRDARHEA